MPPKNVTLTIAVKKEVKTEFKRVYSLWRAKTLKNHPEEAAQNFFLKEMLSHMEDFIDVME